MSLERVTIDEIVTILKKCLEQHQPISLELMQKLDDLRHPK